MCEPPLLLFVANNEDDDLTVVPSGIFALGDMEPPEVRDGHWLLFDATGRQGHLAIEQFDIVLREWSGLLSFRLTH